MTWNPNTPNWKRGKGAATKQRRAKRRAVEAAERAEKAYVRERDGYQCRVPGCTRQPVEVAHIRAKGMGGDHGLRSTRHNMLCLCAAHHRGTEGSREPSVHAGTLKAIGDPETTVCFWVVSERVVNWASGIEAR